MNSVLYRLHGSGTPIGDALELEAMHIARTELKTEQVPIIVGSNKGNLGNCEVRLFISLHHLRPNFRAASRLLGD
jgi:3-oxoacyl-(acyl-carrier-protein) synthase